MSRRVWIGLGVFLLATVILGIGARRTRAAGNTINLTPFSTAFNAPIGIDFFEPTVGSGKLILSVNYPEGLPNNIDLIDAAGVHTPFTSLAGLDNELKIATVRAGSCTGGFTVGTAFISNGNPGGIAKVNPDGTFENPWVVLPGETAQIRGSFYQDRACAFGGDLIVVTGNEQSADNPAVAKVGNVWRVSSTGIAILVATLNKHLEGVITLPNDVAKYGPLAGRIITGDEDRLFFGNGGDANGPNGKIFGIKSASDIITIGAADPDYSQYPNYPTATPLHPEDLDLILMPRPGLAGDGDFFAVDFGAGKVLTAPAADFADKCGDILVTQEIPNAAVESGLSTLRWNGSSFDVTPLINVGPSQVGHFEHVTFRGGADCSQPPNLTIQKVAANHSITAGDTASFTITVTNQGPGTATGVTLTDPLPANLAWTHNRPGTCLIGGGQLTCNIGDLAQGATFSVTLSAPTSAQNCGPINNTATVSGSNEDPTKLNDNSASDSIVVNCPGISIIKFTNGADANDPNGSGVPNVSPGGTITWTYRVTNTGNTSVPKAQVIVTDNTTGVTPSFSSELSGNGDATFNPGEVWLYTATGTALNLTLTPPAGTHTVANSCTANGTQPPRTAYTNVGTATIPGATATDPSSYCNPPPQNLPCPAGSFTYSVDASGNLNIVYDQFPAPNDNSYGTNAVGWGTHAHRFSDLVNSDHAGIQLVDQNGVVRLDFKVDYITAKSGTPSGYASLGVNGGDGGMVVGTADGITADSSLARNLNNLGYFVGGTQVASTKTATNGTDLLVNSPPTVNTTDDYTLKTPNPWTNGWDFHDTYFVTISAAKLAAIGFNAATWKVQPNADELHNSPAKPCPAGGGGECNLTETAKTTGGKEVQITVANGASTDAILTALSLNWPAANGKLMQIKLDGDVVYDNPDIAPPSANLTTAQLVADQNKRKIQHGTSDVLHLVFEKNVDTNLSHYSGTLTFGNCVLTILP